jgi:hypothetical protein
MTSTLLVVATDGEIRCLYDETLCWSALGRLAIRRASYVEADRLGQRHADLSPVAGPRLGPFALRSEALAAERQWLLEHWLT